MKYRCPKIELLSAHVNFGKFEWSLSLKSSKKLEELENAPIVHLKMSTFRAQSSNNFGLTFMKSEGVIEASIVHLKNVNF